MKKSPLSTPGGSFHRGRGRSRGYNTRNDCNNFYRFNYNNSNDSSPNHSGSDMIPLSSSSPIYHNNQNNNRGNRRFQNFDRNQRFPNSGGPGSYNNQRNNYHRNSDSPYSPQKYQRYNQQQNRQKNDPHWYSRLPMSEFVDLKSVFEDPWADLIDKLPTSKNETDIDNTTQNSSVEIILERIEPNSSLESSSDEGTINISSSYDEVKEGSSIDLQLESINFSCDSKETSVLSDSVSSKNESLLETTSESQNDSVVEIVY